MNILVIITNMKQFYKLLNKNFLLMMIKAFIWSRSLVWVWGRVKNKGCSIMFARSAHMQTDRFGHREVTLPITTDRGLWDTLNGFKIFIWVQGSCTKSRPRSGESSPNFRNRIPQGLYKVIGIPGNQSPKGTSHFFKTLFVGTVHGTNPS